MQEEEITMEEKIDKIVQEIDQYQKEIENIKEKLTPTTPLVVKEKRKQEETMELQEIEQQVNTVADLFDKEVQMWTKLEEDQHVQKWDKEE